MQTKNPQMNHALKCLALCIIGFVLTGCIAQVKRNSLRDGYNDSLPVANSKVVVWGANATTVTATTQWLQKVGLRVMKSENFQKFFDKESSSPLQSADENMVLRAAKLSGADYLVMVETFLKPTMVLKKLEGASPNPSGKPETVTVKDLTVSTRGINTKTGRVDWAGMASFPEAISRVDDKLTLLTWDALETAWGTTSRFTVDELAKLHRQQIQSPYIDLLTLPAGGMQ